MELSDEQTQRYSRNFKLKEMGVSGQKKLLASSVLVIGAGGLGSAVIMYLAAAGVGTIGICDHDKVEIHNLQRQIIHTADSVGMPKALSAQRAVKAFNPDINVVVHCQKATADNILDLVGGYDFIIDCTDRFESKFLISDACVLKKKAFCHSGVVRFCGQVMTYLPGKPCLRCLLGSVPHDAPLCADVGVLGAAVGVIGSIQAVEAIKYLLGVGELLSGKVLSFDGLNMTVRVVKFDKPDPKCPICSAESVGTLDAFRDDYVR